MYREIAGTDERVRAIPGVRDRQVRVTKVRLYNILQVLSDVNCLLIGGVIRKFEEIVAISTLLSQ